MNNFKIFCQNCGEEIKLNNISVFFYGMYEIDGVDITIQCTNCWKETTLDYNTELEMYITEE